MDVLLGKCEDYGATVNAKTRSLTGPPAGKHSWCGTEGDLCDRDFDADLVNHEDKSSAANLVRYNLEHEEGYKKHDAGRISRDGAKFGKQYIILKQGMRTYHQCCAAVSQCAKCCLAFFAFDATTQPGYFERVALKPCSKVGQVLFGQ